jgi:hypothetical protein
MALFSFHRCQHYYESGQSVYRSYPVIARLDSPPPTVSTARQREIAAWYPQVPEAKGPTPARFVLDERQPLGMSAWFGASP